MTARIVTLLALTATAHAATPDVSARISAHRNAVAYFDHALGKRAKDPTTRYPLLMACSAAALYAAEPLVASDRAQEMLELVPYLDAEQGSDIQHEGHTLLGLVALRYGHIDDAARELATSAEVSGSPRLATYGPDLSLAKALLARGRRDDVAQYLERVSALWHDDHGCASFWRNRIIAGGTPDFESVWTCH